MRLLFLLCVVVLLSTGCQGITNKVENAINSVVGGAGELISDAGIDAGADNENEEVEKHNAYIGLYNTLLDDVDKVVFDYAEEFGSEAEVYIEDGFSGFSVYTNSIKENLEKALPYADKEPAEPEADAALKALAPDLSEYAETLTAAKKYYGDKNYVDDNYAKAQEFHTVIIGKYDALWEKIDVFLMAVDVMLEGQDEEQLARYEAEGEMIHYYALKAVITAQDMGAYLSNNEISSENALELNLDEFRPLYDAFAAVYAEYDKLVGDSSDAGKDEGIMTLSWFNDDISKVKSHSAELVNRVQSGNGFSSTDIQIAEMRDGTPESLLNSISGLLSSYNSWVV